MKRFHSNEVWPVAALSIMCASLHLPNLRALPIFNDEAIYLRCAQIFRSDPARYPWISLIGRGPPLHIWLLGLFLPISRDPAMAGRFLSVLAAVLTVPALYALCRALVPSVPRGGAVVACAIFGTSPFFHLHDRMARVESLFVLEMVTVTWLGLRLVSSLRSGQPIALHVFTLGLALGLTLLTRQVVSYVLCVLPVVAWVFQPSLDVAGPKRRLGSLAAALASAGLLALALWLPLLLAPGEPSLVTRILPIAAVHDAASKEGWMELTLRNLKDGAAWLWLYLTPPIAVLAIGSLLWAALSGEAWLVVFLVAWVALLLGPAVPFASTFLPRYVLPAAIPFVIGAGFGVAKLIRKLGRVGGGLVVAAVLAWPVRDVLGQLVDWKSQTLAAIDRSQFVSGWPAGFSTEEAVRYLERLEMTQRILVLTSPDSGNPTDAVWLLLEGRPGIELASARSLDQPIFETSALTPGVLRVFGDLRRGSPPRDIPVDPSTPILYVSPEILLTRSGAETPEAHWRRFHPSFRRVARFSNPPYPDGRLGDAVGVYRIDRGE
jgi:hypothetical protein